MPAGLPARDGPALINRAGGGAALCVRCSTESRTVSQPVASVLRDRPDVTTPGPVTPAASQADVVPLPFIGPPRPPVLIPNATEGMATIAPLTVRVPPRTFDGDFVTVNNTRTNQGVLQFSGTLAGRG